MFKYFVSVLIALSNTVLCAGIQDHVGKNGVVRLSDKNFDELVAGPRNYGLLVLLTAEAPQYGCNMCRMMAAPFEKLASSWHSAHRKGDGLHFAVADLTTCQNSFRKLKLTHAPHIWYYPETVEKQDIGQGYTSYSPNPAGDLVTPMKQFVENQSQKKISIVEPVRWDKVIYTTVALALTTLVLRLVWRRVLDIISSRALWASICLCAVIMFTSGHMFNMIRKTHYMSGDGNGGIRYFLPGHSTQQAIETQLIAVAYAILSITTIILMKRAPQIQDPTKQLTYVSILSFVILMTMSFVMSAFKVKNGSYPFNLISLF